MLFVILLGLAGGDGGGGGCITTTSAFVVVPSLFTSSSSIVSIISGSGSNHGYIRCRRSLSYNKKSDNKNNNNMMKTSKVLLLTSLNDEDDNMIKDSSSSLSCPFSMTFPRYRIPISRPTKNMKDKDTKTTKTMNNQFMNLFSNMIQNTQQSELERKYNNNSNGNNGKNNNIINSSSNNNYNDNENVEIVWYDPQTKLSNEEKRMDEPSIVKGKIGVHTTAFIWRALSNVLLYDVHTIAPATSTSTSLPPLARQKKLVIGLPNASLVGLQQLCDIINWVGVGDYTTTTSSSSSSSCSSSNELDYDDDDDDIMTINIHASIDEDVSIPTIIISVSRGTNEDDNSISNMNTTTTTATKMSTTTSKLNEQIVIERTKAWVDRVLVKMQICPFTKSTTYSGQGLNDLGIPVGRIAYHYSTATKHQIPSIMADTWESISNMVAAGPSGKNGISSILLAAPEYDDDFPLWAGPLFAILEAGVSSSFAEPIIGVVCFHPSYKTPDGQSWPGFGHMHSSPRLSKWVSENDFEFYNEINQIGNGDMDDISAAGGAYQRRTPHATINVLRAEQLEAAEGRRSTGSLYTRNVKRLFREGFDKLGKDLEKERGVVAKG